jgi:hypothetical protein
VTMTVINKRRKYRLVSILTIVVILFLANKFEDNIGLLIIPLLFVYVYKISKIPCPSCGMPSAPSILSLSTYYMKLSDRCLYCDFDFREEYVEDKKPRNH